jgi:hypothetical protein
MPIATYCFAIFIMEVNIDNPLNLMISKLRVEVSRFTYPLLAMDRHHRPILYASCVLLEYNRKYFLLTAEHAISTIKKISEVYLGGNQIIHLSEQFVLALKTEKDPLDIAIMELNPDLIKEQKLEFLPLSRTILDREFPSIHVRSIDGFPCSKNKKIKPEFRGKYFSRKSFLFAGEPCQISPDLSSKCKKNGNIHIAMHFHKFGINEKGIKSISFHPKGISGGGLWLTPNILEPTNTFLGGIFIEYYKNDELAFATRIERVIECIRNL